MSTEREIALPRADSDNDPTAVRASRARLPLAFLGLVAIVVAVECSVSRRDGDFTNIHATDWRLAARAASGEAKNADLVLIGDSLLKIGVAPRLLETRLGAKVYNLSVLGGQSVSSYFLLRRLLTSGGRPRMIVVDCQDPPAPRGESKQVASLRDHLRNWPEALDLGEMIAIGWSSGSPTLLAELTMVEVLPSWRMRPEIRSAVVALFGGPPPGGRYEARIQIRNEAANNGSLLFPPVKVASRSLHLNAAGAETRKWVEEPVTSEYLGKLLRLASDHGIRVVWLLPPTSPEHQAYREASGLAAFQTRQADRLRDEFPGLVVVDARGAGIPRGAFRDDTHLDSRGASAFTTDLADVLARAETGRAAWLTLPRIRDLPERNSVEDWDASRLALIAERKARR